MPIGLVVKNGSNARATTSALIPRPVSVTIRETHEEPSSRRRSLDEMIMLPPSDMASRAFTTKLINTFSNWLRSTKTVGRSSASETDMLIFAGSVLCNISTLSLITVLTSTVVGDRGCLRENASNRRVRSAARPAPSIALSINRSTSVSPLASLLFARSRLLITIASILLKSCAMPPVS